ATTEVGRFEGAVCPDADTFRDELPMVAQILEGKEEQPVLLYCTGGIRCEKASAYLRHKGFSQVHQLHGGIIDYVRQVRTQNLPNRFLGKNFVFDDRMGERISEHILAVCHQCGEPCDEHVNCANTACHHLFIQCGACGATFNGCCSAACQAILEAHPFNQTHPVSSDMPTTVAQRTTMAQPIAAPQPKVYRKGRPPGRTDVAAPHAVHPT
ncbi:MAG: hypothetical protein EBS53_10635, partial [Bacteroidetes bacterium]|nr:hypothetical protein [Bacteroidota bacterium]